VFGNHATLERKLRRHGRAALATVLSARVRLPAPTRTTRINDGPMSRKKLGPSLWKMTVRVEPDDGLAFDAKTSAWLKDRPLWVVGVLYDPSDHRKVVIDRSVEARGRRTGVPSSRASVKAAEIGGGEPARDRGRSVGSAVEACGPARSRGAHRR